MTSLPSAILAVIEAFAQSNVRCLLMGGQACWSYGSGQGSKDVDFAVMADAGNLRQLQAVLTDLQAENIAVPPLEQEFFEAGLAVHFRCRREDAAGIRVDVMSKMRGTDSFEVLWERRATARIGQGVEVNILSLRDLILAKKTQRDKDWPMISLLVSGHYLKNGHQPEAGNITFWLEELRDPELLQEVVFRFPAEARKISASRKPAAVACDPRSSVDDIRRALRDEEEIERAADRAYWEPLKKQLEELRRRKHD
jgi:hypothetical protein